jgi:Amt family ammonium transporter
MNGLLSGLVAITAGCAFVEAWAAAVIGIFAGGFYLGASWALIRLRIDDAVDAIPVHLANGLWGVLAVGLFATPDDVAAVYGDGEDDGAMQHKAGLFYTGDATLLGAQVVGILFIFGWTLFTMYPFFLYVNYHGLLRVSKAEEKVGLDGVEQPQQQEAFPSS